LFVSGYRSDNFIVGLTDVSPAITAPTLWNYDLCARYPGVVGEGATVNLTCTSEMPPCRYLIVQIQVENEALNFCEVEVFVRRKLIFTLCKCLVIKLLTYRAINNTNIRHAGQHYYLQKG